MTTWPTSLDDATVERRTRNVHRQAVQEQDRPDHKGQLDPPDHKDQPDLLDRDLLDHKGQPDPEAPPGQLAPRALLAHKDSDRS